MNRQANHFYEFNAFRVDATQRVLLRDGKPAPLKAKAFDLLLALVERSGHIVEKEELINAVWPDTFVEEGNLNVHIFALRKALGSDGDKHRYIETVPRRGYRFVAEVKEFRAERQSLLVYEPEGA